MRIPVSIEGPLAPEYLYTLNSLGAYYGHEFVPSDSRTGLHVGAGGVETSREFERLMLSGVTDHRAHFLDEPVIRTKGGDVDNLSTSFYLLACVQEWGGGRRDQYGRFPYEASLQKRFDVAGEDLVSTHYKDLLRRSEIPELDPARLPVRRSRVFLSHDIDSLAHSTTDQLKFAVKRMDLPALMRGVFAAVLRRNDKRDLDRIMRMEEEHDLRSTYFWLTEQDEHDGIPHADYQLDDPRVATLQRVVRERGHEHGLHKSARDGRFADELGHLPAGTIANRYHFLRFRIPDSLREAESSGIRVDASLGFAATPGFRNNYGLPFRPWDPVARRPLNLLEVPLNVMDTTFIYYQRVGAAEARDRILAFLDRSREDRVISILFHNEYLTDGVFGPWLRLYRDLLLYLKEDGWTCIGPRGLVEGYGQTTN